MFTSIRLQYIKMNISDILMLCLTALFLFSSNLSELLSINIPATPYFMYWFNKFFPFFFIAYIFQRFNKIEEWTVNLFLFFLYTGIGLLYMTLFFFEDVILLLISFLCLNLIAIFVVIPFEEKINFKKTVGLFILLSLIFMTIISTFSTYHSYLFISNKIVFDKDITSIALDQNKTQIFKYDSSLRRVIISTKVKVEKEEFQNIEIKLSLTEDELKARFNKPKKQSNIL